MYRTYEISRMLILNIEQMSFVKIDRLTSYRVCLKIHILCISIKSTDKTNHSSWSRWLDHKTLGPGVASGLSLLDAFHHSSFVSTTDGPIRGQIIFKGTDGRLKIAMRV